MQKRDERKILSGEMLKLYFKQKFEVFERKLLNIFALWKFWLIIAIAIFLILCYCYPSTDQYNARYILSAISQGLAAILALVFTITLVVAQMTRRYTAMDKIIFRRGTIFLMIAFGIGIVIPLLVLKFGFFGHGVNLSIAIAAFCVFSLIPFLKGVNGVFKYEFGVNALYKEIMVAIESENKESVDVGELAEIGECAVTEAPENAVVTIIHFLSQIGKKCAEKGLGDETYWVIYKLRYIGVKSVEMRFNEASLFTAIGLQGVGVVAAKVGLKGGLEDPALIAIEGLKIVGCEAAKKRLNETTIRTVDGLKDVGKASDEGTNEGIRAKYIAVNGLWCLGAFAMKFLHPEQVNHVIKNLKEMEKEIGRDLLMRWEKNCISAYPDIKDSLEKFKRRYEKG